jgi:hypothetical protein
MAQFRRVIALTVVGALAIIGGCTKGGSGESNNGSSSSTPTIGSSSSTPTIGSSSSTPTIGSSSSTPTIGSSSSSGSRGSPVRDIPVTPPMPFQENDSASKALEASDAMAAGASGRTAAVVAALAASGVPVIGPDGIPVKDTGSDAVGVPWWYPALSGDSQETATYSLDDLVGLLYQSLPSPKDPMAGETAELMDQIRYAHLYESDLQVHFFIDFLAAVNQRLGGPDLFDSSTTAEMARVDAPAALVFLGRWFRTGVGDIVTGAGSATPTSSQGPPSSEPPTSSAGPPSSAGSPSPGRSTSSAGPARPARALISTPANAPGPAGSPPADCTDKGSVDYGTWLASRIPAVGVGDVAFAGLLKAPAKVRKKPKITGGPVSNVDEIQQWVKQIVSIAEGAAAITSVKMSAAWKGGTPLVRNQKKSEGDGKSGTAILTFNFDPATSQNVPECVRDYIENITKPGALKGLPVAVIGGTGFPPGHEPFINFKTPRPNFVTTNPSGQVEINLLGLRQTKDVPTPPRPFFRNATLLAKAASKAFEDIKNIGDAVQFLWRLQVEAPLKVKDWGTRYAFFAEWPWFHNVKRVVAGVSCGDPATGKWQVISTNKRVSPETLVSTMNAYRFTDIQPLGGRFLASVDPHFEGSITAVVARPKDKPPTIHFVIYPLHQTKIHYQQNIVTFDINSSVEPQLCATRG